MNNRVTKMKISRGTECPLQKMELHEEVTFVDSLEMAKVYTI